MAWGSQLQKGNWALFVIAPKISKIAAGQVKAILVICQWLVVMAMSKISATSPTRLVRAVMRLAPAAYGF